MENEMRRYMDRFKQRLTESNKSNTQKNLGTSSFPIDTDGNVWVSWGQPEIYRLKLSDLKKIADSKWTEGKDGKQIPLKIVDNHGKTHMMTKGEAHSHIIDVPNKYMKLIQESVGMGHNFSIYDDIESELAEIPNDEAIEYLMGIIKHCEKLIKELDSIIGKRVIWQGKEHTIYDVHQEGKYVMLDDEYGPSVDITELQFID